MKVHEILSENHEHPNLDRILRGLGSMVLKGQQRDDGKFGWVAACLLDPEGNQVRALNYRIKDGHRVHAERAAIEKYEKKYGDVPSRSVIITTLSPCSEHMHDREGKSCTDLLNAKKIRRVYCGYIDPTQPESKKMFDVVETSDREIRDMCKGFADTFL
jgi:pyrimidine deaminase RibD-like protein